MPPTTAPAKVPLKADKPTQVPQQLCGIRYSPKGDLLVAGTFEGGLRRWKVTAADLTDLPPLAGHDAWVQCVAFDPKDARFFSADSWGRLNAWAADPLQTKPVWSVADAHSAWVHALAVHPKGETVATAGRDRTIRQTDPVSGKEIKRWDAGDDVLAMTFHPSGQSLVTGDLHGVIKEWDPATGKVKRELDAKQLFLRDRIQDTGGVRCFAWNTDATVLFAGGSQPKSGGFVQGVNLVLGYDWASGQQKSAFKSANEADGYVLDLHWNPAGYLIGVASGQPGQGKLFLLKPGEAQPFHSVAIPNAHSLAVHPDGKRLLVSATNANSSGNGRPAGKDKEYPGNTSPLHGFDITE